MAAWVAFVYGTVSMHTCWLTISHCRFVWCVTVRSNLPFVCPSVFWTMLPWYCHPVTPGAFTGPGSNAAAAAMDPALAAMYNQICIWEYGGPRQYRGNSGIDVEVRVFLNANGEADADIRAEAELRRVARVVVTRAVVAACARS